MPVYDFHCNGCKKDFTLVMPVKDYEKAGFTCPSCQTKDVERAFELEAVGVVTSKKS